MKMVDEGRMLPNGQAQGSSGLNNNPIKAEAEVREQSALDIVESVLLPSYIFPSYCDLTFYLFSWILLGSDFSLESGGRGCDAAQWSGSGHQWIEQQSHQGGGGGT